MKKNIVLVDIDGTISKVGDRLKYLEQEPKDWDSFYEACDEDEPINHIVNLVENLCESGYGIVFCTGRRESVRTKTEDWIKDNFSDQFYYIDIVMRKDGDKRHDTISKIEALHEAGIARRNIDFVLEDRNSMVVKWRELGLTCLQVADGDF